MGVGLNALKMETSREERRGAAGVEEVGEEEAANDNGSEVSGDVMRVGISEVSEVSN